MRFDTNEQGQLQLGGVSCLKLANQYGTPLYVFEEEKIRTKMQIYKKAMEEFFSDKGMICFASKSFCCKEILRIAMSEGLGADVVSAGELHTALSVGFPMEKVCFHGNNKSKEELSLALENNVARIVVDNLTELELLSSLCQEKNKKAKIMLRIKPGVEAHTHEFIQTGQIDSKFGWALETGEAMAGVRKSLATKNIELVGLHCHIGSQILDSAPFELAAEIMVGFLAEIFKETKTILPEINLGGGFGIVYTNADVELSLSETLKKVAIAVKRKAKEHEIEMPFVIFEPGRSIVGESGTTLYTVGSVKTIPGVRTYVAVDGGMCDNPRFALYQSEYEFLIANKANCEKSFVATVAGKCCESGDLLGKDVLLQKPEVGDVLAVRSTGAYNFSMAMQYNRNLRPPVVFVRQGQSRLVVRGDNFEDILRGDL